MNRLRRAWLRQRHGRGPWALLFTPPPEDEWVSLDLETTGLDPRRDEILALAAVPVRGQRICLSERFERRVRPMAGFGIESIRHHRLRPDDVAGGITAETAVLEFLRWLGPRRLLGYHLAFDLALIERVARPQLGFALPQPRVDLALAFASAWRRRHPLAAPDLGFEVIAVHLGVPVLGRHTALGDAVTAGVCWLALRGGALGRR